MIKRTTTNKVINDYLANQLDLKEKAIISSLAFVGEKCVNHARSVSASSGFTDQTGNLRSSIGYAIIKNGVVISMSAFPVVKSGGKGKSEGIEFVNEIARGLKGLNLVVVAGMKYALALESGKRKTRNGKSYSISPRDVLTSSELLAEREVPKMLRQLGFIV